MSDSCVYVRDAKFGWLPANVVSQTDQEVTVKVFNIDGSDALGERTVKLKDYPNKQLPLQNIDSGGNLMEMADMVDLPSLHEAAIVYNLKERHAKKLPYTRVGDLIIAVNPFQWLDHLYSDQNRNKYVEQLIYNASNKAGSDIRAGLDPHVYETSCMAYRGLAVDGTHQSVLVSGESGAGKTETVKIVMGHLSSIQGESGKSSLIVKRVMDGQPLLEAFGNAKTVRNDNSSRFGKFIQMQFDVEDATQAAFSGRAVPNCVLAGSTCETYLLEKSRVVSHEPEERTYHVFYQVVEAPEEIKKEFIPVLVGKGLNDFRYVGESTTLKIEGKTNSQQFERTYKALTLLNIKDDVLKTLFMAVCCVMQLGNIIFEEDPNDSDRCVISSREELSTLADWLGVSTEMAEKSLTFRTIVAGKESYPVPLKVGDARDGCDAFAKEIYQQVFDWLVRKINEGTCAENNYEDAGDVEEYGLIGLLDIFGFESFKVNRFEQLCINYTNEKLQQKYTLDIFRSVQDEYSHEGIDLGDIPFADNAEVLRLIEGKIGIISVLNEECVRPKGNDTAFVSKIKTVNKEVTCLISERLHKPTEFAIEHYAGVVKYDATNFVQKNTDALPKDLIECATASSNAIINVELKAAADAKSAGGSGGGRGRRGAATLTVGTKFKAQLAKLMADITQTKTRYIRCIKPNPQKVPIEMDVNSSAEQLKCAGVVAAVTISRVAFPNRLMHETALERFSCLGGIDLDTLVAQKKPISENDETGFRDAITSLLNELLKNLATENEEGAVVQAFECGRSRVYFRLGALEFLEAERLKALGVFAIKIERMARGFTARSKFWKLRDAAIDSQAFARGAIARKRFLKKKAACIQIECWARCQFARHELVRRQRDKAATTIESKWRSVMAVAMLTKSRNAAITIQKISRGAIQRPKYRQALKEAQEEARVNSKVAALQKRLKEAEMKLFAADKKRIAAERKAAAMVQDGVQLDTLPGDDDAGEDGDAMPEEKKMDGPASAQQQALIDESNEMLEYFRKEVFKLKSANYLLRTDYGSLQEDHRQLQAHAASLEASYNAMKQNVARMSLTNNKLGHQLTDQKDYIGKLRQDIKMDRIRHNAELKRRDEAVLGKKKLYETELNRYQRELERLKNIIAEGGDPEAEEEAAKIDVKFERATFHQEDDLSTSLLRSKAAGASAAASSLSALTAVSSSEDGVGGSYFDDDGYYNRYRRPYFVRRKHPRFYTRAPSGGRFGGRFGGGRFDDYHNRYNSAPRGTSSLAASAGRGPVAMRGHTPVSPSPTTSLGAAVTKNTPTNSSLAQAMKNPQPNTSVPQQQGVGRPSLQSAAGRNYRPPPGRPRSLQQASNRSTGSSLQNSSLAAALNKGKK